MKRRNADCGKIRRPIKKNKIAEQIGSNTLLYIKFLLLWVSVITADFLLEFRFEFLWPFWLLLRSIYDSFKYKGLAFSVLFVCIAVTSDLVCLFFIPVQWLFFAASTYVWVQYVWHTDKGICLPTIILWILFVYLEAAIRWKDSRNIPHLNLCRPFAAHCIGYPVVTLGFGFKSYVGYRIRQRKQREVAKDNDFYMQLLQEALPKEESRALEPLADGATGTGGTACEQQTSPKELVAVTMSNNNNSLNNSSSSTTSNRSDTGQHHHNNHHNHNHHHHNHQQQQHTNHSKSTQGYKSTGSSSVTTAHVNGHVGGGSSPPSSSTSTMNGSLHHSSHQQQGSSKHRKSLEKDSSTSSNASSNSSNTFNAGSKMNGGSGGSGGTCYFPQTTTFQQSGNNSSFSSSTSNSSNSSNNGSTTISTKEISNTTNRGNDHNGSIHCNGSTVAKDSKENSMQGLTPRKDYDKETNNSSNSAGSNSSSLSSSGKHGNGQPTASSRSKSPTDSGALGNKSNAGKQNGHISQYHQPELAQQVTVTEITTPGTESKGGSSGRSGRKNRLKKAAEQANLSAIAKLCATLALASSVTTLTTTTTATTSSHGGGDKGATITSSSYTTSGSVSSVSVKDNHQHNSEQVKDAGDASNGGGNSSGSAESKSDGSAASPVSGTHRATTMTMGSSGQATSIVSPTPVATAIVQKVCETCPRLEGDLKKLRAELSSHRQTENDLRQKYDSNTNNLKACLQAKQKDYDELQNRYQEHCNQRQQERQNLQTVERRLGEERRHRQSLEAQLNNERKYRKQAEEKAARAECSEGCKMKKQQMEIEIDKLQNELHSIEEVKLMAEKQARNYEQEMRKMELQLRNCDSQQNTEVLMSALAAMQDKNATLEKSLSAETRFKLDLFSALGGTRREVEILTGSLRAKEKEILELNAKIVQLLAVMPSENLCLTSHGGGTGTDGASMMRLADAPQLLPQSMTSGHLNGIGQSSGGGGGGGTGAGGGGGGGGMSQQASPMSHMVQNGPSFCSQLGSLGVLTSTMTTLPSSSVLSGPNSSTGNGSNGGQIVQMQNSNNGGSNAGNCPSGLDPNATIYTPKNNGMVGGTEA